MNYLPSNCFNLSGEIETLPPGAGVQAAAGVWERAALSATRAPLVARLPSPLCVTCKDVKFELERRVGTDTSFPLFGVIPLALFLRAGFRDAATAATVFLLLGAFGMEAMWRYVSVPWVGPCPLKVVP
jgi:hypothetical protein